MTSTLTFSMFSPQSKIFCHGNLQARMTTILSTVYISRVPFKFFFLIFIKYLLCAKYLLCYPCYNHFSYINLFNPYNNPMGLIWLISLLFKRKDCHTSSHKPQAIENNKYSSLRFIHTSLWIKWTADSIRRHQAYGNGSGRSYYRSYRARGEVFGLSGTLSPNFPQKLQNKIFGMLISNTWLRVSFQTDSGIQKRGNLGMHMSSEMCRHCGLRTERQIVPVRLGLGDFPACETFSGNIRKFLGKLEGVTLYSKEIQSYFDLPETPGGSCFISKFTRLLISLASISL